MLSKKVFGKGITDITTKDSSGKSTHSYTIWKAMLSRCYSGLVHKESPTYIGCTVSEEWLTFSNFKAWYDKNYSKGFHLDKDILSEGNKVYSHKDCRFIPAYINTLISRKPKTNGVQCGVYKVGKKFKAMVQNNGKPVYLGLFDTAEEAFQEYKYNKETVIMAAASSYFAKGLIDKDVACALVNYEVKPY